MDAQRHHGERHGGSKGVWASNVGCGKEKWYLGAVGGHELARLLLEQREELVGCRVVTVEGIGHWTRQRSEEMIDVLFGWRDGRAMIMG